MKKLLVLAAILLTTCTPAPVPQPAVGAIEASATLEASNSTEKDTIVYISFGADSAVLPGAWSFCEATAKLNCSFPLKAGEVKDLPLSGKYLNATFAFGSVVGCGSTKAELNLNNPKWYDIADVSLVDGYSNKIWIEATDAGKTDKLGPPNGADGNEKVFGLYPKGCDICTARKSPPCGQEPGTDGCKAGSQYDPEVPCQWKGSTMGGGSAIKLVLAE